MKNILFELEIVYWIINRLKIIIQSIIEYPRIIVSKYCPKLIDQTNKLYVQNYTMLTDIECSG